MLEMLITSCIRGLGPYCQNSYAHFPSPPGNTPQEAVLPGCCGCDHWDNSHCNHHNSAQEVAGHQKWLIIFLILILYRFKT